VKLEDLISVDSEGEKVLQQILTESALVIVSRAYIKHVAESLKVRYPWGEEKNAAQCHTRDRKDDSSVASGN
jgi:hypothetical protein